MEPHQPSPDRPLAESIGAAPSPVAALIRALACAAARLAPHQRRESEPWFAPERSTSLALVLGAWVAESPCRAAFCRKLALALLRSGCAPESTPRAVEELITAARQGRGAASAAEVERLSIPLYGAVQAMGTRAFAALIQREWHEAGRRMPAVERLLAALGRPDPSPAQLERIDRALAWLELHAAHKTELERQRILAEIDLDRAVGLVDLPAGTVLRALPCMRGLDEVCLADERYEFAPSAAVAGEAAQRPPQHRPRPPGPVIRQRNVRLLVHTQALVFELPPSRAIAEARVRESGLDLQPGEWSVGARAAASARRVLLLPSPRDAARNPRVLSA